MEINPILQFIQEAEKFKKTDKYQEMPSNLRDYFNEEIGRFKLMLELLEKSVNSNDV